MHRRRRAPSFLLAVGLLAACGRGAPAPVVRGGAASAASSAAAVVAVPAEASSRSDASAAAPVGFADLSPPSAAAVKANDEGVAALAKGSLPLAVERLRAAIGLAPGFVLARYNLACALARNGEHSAAAVELAAVFEVDWVGLRAQAARDGDLASFRESAEGKALFARDAEREARYQTAIARGVRALFWTARAPGATTPESLRIGVWDAATERFVAVSERRRGEYGAFVAGDLSYAVLATGRDLEPGGDMGDHVRVKDVTFWSWDTRGVPLATITPDTGALGAHVYLRGEDATLSLSRGAPFDTNPNSDKYAARATFDPAAGASKVVLLSHAANVIPPKDPARFRGELAFPYHNGWRAQLGSAGYAWDAKTRRLSVPSGRALEIAKTLVVANEPSVVASPSGDVVALVWDAHSCGDACGGDVITMGAHRIVLVDVASGAAKEIARGTGVGMVRFAPSGAMFVQRDRKVFHAKTRDDASTWTPLPANVLLVAPVVKESDVHCCGF